MSRLLRSLTAASTWNRIVASGLFIFLAVLTLQAVAQSQPKFSDYSTPSYKGKIHLPDWIHRDADGEWRDEADKAVEPPIPNFAGSYYVAIHSCGTGCRYHTITNLATGATTDALSMFDAGEEHSKTRDGFPYLTILRFSSTSKMLIAQYMLEDPNADLPGTPLLVDGEQVCRERMFVLRDEKLVPITATKKGCTKTESSSEARRTTHKQDGPLFMRPPGDSRTRGTKSLPGIKNGTDYR